MIRSVVFDMGGVLAYDVWEHLLLDESLGIAAQYHLDDEDVFQFGQQIWDEHAYVSRDGLERQYWRTFIDHFKPDVSENTLINQTDAFIRPVEGMIPLLEKLKSKGLNLALCSNNNAFWLQRQMDKLALHRFFDADRVIASCEVGVPKASPHFEMFRAVMDVIGGDPSSVIFVEDRMENIFRAIEFGWCSIYFPQESSNGAFYLESLLSSMGVI